MLYDDEPAPLDADQALIAEYLLYSQVEDHEQAQRSQRELLEIERVNRFLRDFHCSGREPS